MISGLFLLFLTLASDTPVKNTQSVWNDMISAYSKKQALQVDIVATGKSESDAEPDPTATIRTRMIFKRNNQFRLEQATTTNGQRKVTLIVCDGKKLYTPFGDQLYGRKAPDELKGIYRFFDRSIPDPGNYLKIILGTERDSEKLYKNLENAVLDEPSVITEIPVDVIKADYQLAEETKGIIYFYIGTEDKLLYRIVLKVNIIIQESTPEGPVGEPKTVPFTYEWNLKYNLNPKIDDKTFLAPPNAITGE